MVVSQPTLRLLFGLDGDLAAVKVLAISDAATNILRCTHTAFRYGLSSVHDKVLTYVALDHEPTMFVYTNTTVFSYDPSVTRWFVSVALEHHPLVLVYADRTV